MVRRAAAFLARNGPVSPQDRWEEEPGYSPFTIATEIAALLVAADLADADREHDRGGRICARRPTPGTPASNDGCMCRERNWRSSTASTAITCAWRAPDRADARVAVSGIRADQEPASGSIDGTGGLDGQPRRARVRALRAARAG